MFKKPFLYLLLMLLSADFKAQNNSIIGVVSTSDGKPAMYVSVYIKSISIGTTTNEKGEYKLSNIPEGEHTLFLSAIGYSKESKKVNLTKEENVILNFTVKEIASELDELVVTATLKEISKSNSPVAIDIITPQLFKKNPSPTIFESLNMVNGVRPQLQCNVCNSGDIHINGMEGPYTMVMIDGMPIVSALGTVYGLMGIPNSIIERVEIQKGPASTLYGSEAVGGLINVITKSPTNAPLFSLDINATSYEEINSDVSVRYKINNKLSGLFSGNYFHFDKRWDVNNDNFTDVTIQKRIAGFNKISYKHRTEVLSNIAIRYFYESRWGGEMQWNESFRLSDSIYGESIYTNRLELIGNSPLLFLGNETNFQYSFISHLQNSAYGETPFEANQYIAFSQITKNFHYKNNDILTGLALRFTHYDDNTIITKTEDSLNYKNMPTISYLPGIFIQDEIKLNKKNGVLVGLRYDYNSKHGNILSPRINWMWKPNGNNTIRLGIGNGYRVVNLFSEDHAAFNGARKVEIANKLKPEQSWNANVSYSKFIVFKHGFLTIESSAFYTYFGNKIVADYFTNSEKVIFDNLNGYGITRGGGVMAHCTFTIPLKVIIGATYSDVYIVKQDSLGRNIRTEQVHSPPLTGNFVVGYNFQKLKFSIDFTGNLYSPMLLPVFPNDYRSDHSPWFNLLNIQLTKEIKSSWEFYFGIKNLFNYTPKEDPIMRPFDPFDKNIDNPKDNPFGYTFDPGYNYAPMQGIRFFTGIRYALK